MAVPFSNTKLRVPQGFQTLLEMLSREILQEQPTNVYEKSAEYLEFLLKKREAEGSDPTVDQSKLDDREYNNHAFKEKPGVNDGNTDEAATRIQAAVRAHGDRESANPEPKPNQSD